VRVRRSGIPIAALLCLGLFAPAAWAKAPSNGDIVIKRGTLHVDPSGEPSAQGRVKWRKGASDTPGVDCCTNRVYPLDGTGTFFDTTANRFSIRLTPTFRAYRIDSYDAAGAYVGSTFAPDETFVDAFEVDDDASWSFTGDWTPSIRSGAYEGGVTRTTAAGASARFELTAHSFGIVVTKGPGFGSAAVYLDGKLVGTVDCYAATIRTRKIALVVSPDRAGFDEHHELTVVNLATAGRPRLEIDAMATLWSD
jgi:hypothetical protein